MSEKTITGRIEATCLTGSIGSPANAVEPSIRDRIFSKSDNKSLPRDELKSIFS